MYNSGQNLFKDLDIIHGVGGGRGVEVHDVTYRHLAYLASTYLTFTYLTITHHTLAYLCVTRLTFAYLCVPRLTFTNLTTIYRAFTYLTFSYLSLTHLDQGEVADKENIVDRQLDMTWREATIRHRHGIVRDKGLLTSQEARGAVEVQAVGVVKVDRGTQSCDYALWGLRESHGCRLTTQLSSDDRNLLYVSTHSMDGLH